MSSDGYEIPMGTAPVYLQLTGEGEADVSAYEILEPDDNIAAEQTEYTYIDCEPPLPPRDIKRAAVSAWNTKTICLASLLSAVVLALIVVGIIVVAVLVPVLKKGEFH